ncbi:hypothetical protein ABFZ85_14550 [Hyphococcus formosus]|uniref:hypothetical protein n=1 Tax=Hyphococcus formosus TaxID=3143534 RepID=UPI00398AC3B0
MPVAANAAQTLPVRAGEHGEYSRLVIPNAPDDWRIATSNRKIEIAFPDQDFSFDLSELMEKRKAHRVLSAKAITNGSARSLVLSLTCDCPVRTSKSSENSIIIDIFNPGPVNLIDNDGAITAASDEQIKKENPTPENLRAARDRMISLLAEARHQGVVQLKIDDERAAAEEASKVTEITQASFETLTNDDPLVDEAPLTEYATIDAEPTTCIDPTLFAQPSADQDQISYGTIANLRQRFDITDNEDERRDLANTLAIAYLHIGFFEEASSVASSRGKNGDENMIVTAALANLATGSSARAKKTLAKYRSCGPLFELAYSAAAGPEDELATTMSETHVAALAEVTEPLRAPIAEVLALNALEKKNKGLARSFYELAVGARHGDKTAAIAIIERALGQSADENAVDRPTSVQIAEIARTPGPLQSKALALLAEEYRQKAEIAYDGLLDDLAAQSSNKGGTLSDARAALSGAEALVSAGRINDGIAVLDNTASTVLPARAASQTLARAIIMDALQKDNETRLSAVSAYFQHKDFIDGREDERDSEVNLAIAKELAQYGATELVTKTVSGIGDKWQPNIDALLALAALNGDNAKLAIEIATKGNDSTELTEIAIAAHERIRDNNGTKSSIKQALAKGLTSDKIPAAAWRTKDWALAIDAYERLPDDEKTPELDARVALASLNAGARELPSGIKQRLTNDPTRLAALTHMFVTAPPFNIRAIDVLADYSKGVTKETLFMQTGLGTKGEGR